MNATEQAYAQRLEVLKRSGEIIDYQFEGIKLRLARSTHYTPDFLVITPLRVEFHEVKGWWREDARVKWKVAAELFPWAAFIAVQRKGRGWEFEEYGCSKVAS